MITSFAWCTYTGSSADGGREGTKKVRRRIRKKKKKILKEKEEESEKKKTNGNFGLRERFFLLENWGSMGTPNYALRFLIFFLFYICIYIYIRLYICICIYMYDICT